MGFDDVGDGVCSTAEMSRSIYKERQFHAIVRWVEMTKTTWGHVLTICKREIIFIVTY